MQSLCRVYDDHFLTQYLWLSSHSYSYVQYPAEKAYEVLGESLIAEAHRVIRNKEIYV